MEKDKVLQMPLAKIYPLLVQKAERKGRTRGEVDEVIFWLTGYTAEMVEQCIARDMTYGDFFAQAPHLNADRALIRGVVCGVRVEAIEDDPLSRQNGRRAGQGKADGENSAEIVRESRKRRSAGLRGKAEMV